MSIKIRKVIRILLIALLFVLAIPGLGSQAQSTQPAVYTITIDGEITPAMAAFLQRSLDDAEAAGAAGVLIEIRTLGGLVVSAVDMRDAIVAADIPVVVFVAERAISAGALITIAADTIIMSPGSHVGAAEPIPNEPKAVAYVSGEFRTTAELRGRDPQIALAMVDRSVVIEGLKDADTILDMTASEAAARGYADFIADDRQGALAAMGWQNYNVVDVEPDFRFNIAQFLTSYEVASILFTIGLLALVAELFIPGFGVAGFIGIACFALYFSSGFLAGYTEWWAALVFVAGLVLLLIEIAVPGFGVFGIAGLIAVFAGVVLAAPSPQQGLLTMAIALAVILVAIPVFIKIFGKARFVRHLVLSNAETTEKGFVHAAAKTELLGLTGTTLTVLRPAGSVQIAGLRTDAIAEGEFIEKGEQVKVIRVEGNKVVVAAVE